MIWADTCIGIFLALAFIGVGATVVRTARPMSGYLLVGAGVLELLSSCCTGVARASQFYGFVGGYEGLRIAYGSSALGSALVQLIAGVLLAIAVSGLASAVKSAKG